MKKLLYSQIFSFIYHLSQYLNKSPFYQFYEKNEKNDQLQM